jgi:EAL domain-containing protein (putative c-di-GMP-specific phosphodiesterase class I)
MGDYDMIVLEKVVELCKKSQEGRYAITVAATSIRNQTVFAKIKDLLSQDEAISRRVILLFSENEYYPKIERFNTLLQRLRDTGVLIAVDRVGSLHTSFLYLRDLDIDIMRLSPFYTQNIDKKSYHGVIAGFQVMAHAKGVKSWMRMVEDKNSKESAQELGIDYLQGKYLALPEKI